jgi:hypothetical protein
MLPFVLGNLERMGAVFARSAFLFLENGSTDATRAILERWCVGRPDARVLSPESSDASSPQRTVRLAALRNQLVAAVGARFADFDLLVIADCDDVNATPIMNMTGFSRAVDFLRADESHAAVFANTLGVYYDMWALRHPERCPNDVWEATMDHALASGVSDEKAAADIYAPRVFLLPPGAPPLEVESAFGGLGIYRMAQVLANPAPYQGYKIKAVPAPDGGVREIGWQCCEHVAFNAGLHAQKGRLFVLPWLVIGDLEEVTIPQSAWRQMAFELADLSAPAAAPVSEPVSGPARNEPCSCGSGRRYKHCHGALA